MFELLDSTAESKKHRGWSTLTSLILQASLIGIMVLIPLWFTDTLPKQQLLTYLVAPPPPPPPPPAPAAAPQAAATRAVRVDSELFENGGLRAPTRVPQRVAMITEEEAPPPAFGSGGVVGGVPGGVPGGELGGVIGGIVNATNTTAYFPKIAKPEVPKVLRITTGVSEGMLVNRVAPDYPKLAREARIQGTVVLDAIIGKDGTIQNLHVISGHPMLVPAAIEAVRQWRYRPYMLNHEPVDIETQILVSFTLNG